MRNWMTALLCLLAAPLFGANLVNPSFEEQGEGPDRAAGWERWGAWINRESGWSPVLSGRCIMAYHHYQIENGDTSGLWQDVSGAKAGQRYTFKVMATVDRADGAKKDAQSVELRLESTVRGKQVVLETKSYRVEDLAVGDDWSELQVTGTAAADSLRVLVIFYPSSKGPRDGAVKLDDASLESISGGAPTR